MTLEKKLPYHWLSVKPDIENDYFMTTPLTRKEPVKHEKLNKLIRWVMGCLIVMATTLMKVEAFKEFSSNAQSLTFIFLFGFWFVLIYMAFTMRGFNNERIGMLAILQMLFGVVIGLNFWEFSSLIALGVLGASMSVFVVFMFGDR